jgi:RNA polymerase primary sigma factor
MKNVAKITGSRSTRAPNRKARVTGVRAGRPRLGRGRPCKENPVAPVAETAQVVAAVLPVEPVQTAADRADSSSSRGDMLHLYLREIGQVKLLTPAEEVKLAKLVQKGNAEAREQMIKANLRLVVKIARDYEGQGLPLLDLINEGNIGLMKGVERFDPTKGAKLSTYASLWIKQSIRRALSNQSKTIRLPDHVVDKVSHIRKAENILHEMLDREPTDEEVAQHMGMDARRVRIYREAARAPISLDAPLSVGSGESDPVSDVVADPNAAAPFERLLRETDTALVKEVFGDLTEREKSILEMRFGLDNRSQKTLDEVGKHFGVTRERIRQIQDGALKKLRVKMEQREALLPHN